jgi:hypothetical protein
MSEVEDKKEVEENKAIPREPTLVPGAKERKGAGYDP